MEVGEVTQNVEVQATAQLLRTENANVSQVVATRAVEETPVNGRNLMALTTLVPGVISNGTTDGNAITGKNVFAAGNYQIGGGMANQGATFYDGVPNNSVLGNLVNMVPSPDVVSEFRVESNSNSSEYGRSLAALFTIGGAFVINAFVTAYATGGTASYAIRVPVLAGLLAINAGLYFASFALLTAKAVGPRGLLPGAILAAVGFTALITVGTGLMTHQLKNASATYGAFGTVIGIVAFLLLLAKLTMYAAELNPVLARSLYPRALPLGGEPTAADRQVLADLVDAEQRRDDQAIGVGFGDRASTQAASDAARHTNQPQ